jgi:hypothetical protein
MMRINLHDYNMLLMEKMRIEEIARKQHERELMSEAKLAGRPPKHAFHVLNLRWLFRRPGLVSGIPAMLFAYLTTASKRQRHSQPPP